MPSHEFNENFKFKIKTVNELCHIGCMEYLIQYCGDNLRNIFAFKKANNFDTLSFKGKNQLMRSYTINYARQHFSDFIEEN